MLLAVCAATATAQTRGGERRRVTPQTISTKSNEQILPIRRVILYSNGVAYIERRGLVPARAEINLSFKQSQVDDVLKSMLVLDLGGGRIGAVSYNSSAPPSARMAEIPFSVESATDGASGGLAGVLAQLQGAKVSVVSTKGAGAGSILTVEKRDIKTDDGKTSVAARFLVIAGENGELSSFDLADVRSIKLLDAGAQKDLTEFASATASARRRDAKTITVTSDGQNAREMMVSYTIAAPIWKTTYRVVLDDAGKPFFQGWAIVDNVSDEDWRDVNLSLVSGTPISFVQPIQNPFYRYRPVVPIPGDLKLTPQVYENGVDLDASSTISGIVKDPNDAVIPNANVKVRNSSTGQETTTTTDNEGRFRASALAAGNYTVTVSASGFNQFAISDVKVGAGRANNFNVRLNVGGVSQTVTVTSKEVEGLPLNGRQVSQLQLNVGVAQSNSMNVDSTDGKISTTISGGKSGVETAATGDEIGDLFEYRIAQPITVNRDRSALIPIIQTAMEGERVSIYNEAVRRERPLSGMLLKNLTDLTFESGAMTVIDRDAYAGEALMERLKPKEQRLISFALDLGTLVTTDEDGDDEPARIVKVVNGAIEMQYFSREKKTYKLSNQIDRPRTIFIEHPVRDDWKLTDDTPKPTITTQKYYRFRVELKPFEKTSLTVTEKQSAVNRFTISSITRDQIELFVKQRYINDATRQKLERLLDLRQQIAQTEQKISDSDKENAAIAADQKRLRDNIEALSKTPEAKTLIARYIAKAGEQETRIEQITKERQTLQAERVRLENELAAQIRAFEI